MARHAHPSPRTFARCFQRETGTTPLPWPTGQLVLPARHHLETTDDPVSVVAHRTGFGTVDNLRHPDPHALSVEIHVMEDGRASRRRR